MGVAGGGSARSGRDGAKGGGHGFWRFLGVVGFGHSWSRNVVVLA